MVIFHSKLVDYQRDSHRRIEKANLRFGERTSSANLFWNEGDFHRMSLCWVYTLQSSKKTLVHQFGPLKQSLPASNNCPGTRDSPHRAPTGATIGFAAIAAQMLLPYIVAAPHPQKCPMSQNRDVRERRDKKFSAGAVPNPSNHKPILKFMVNFSDRVDARIARKTVRACWAIVVEKHVIPFSLGHSNIVFLNLDPKLNSPNNRFTQDTVDVCATSHALFKCFDWFRSRMCPSSLCVIAVAVCDGLQQSAVTWYTCASWESFFNVHHIALSVFRQSFSVSISRDIHQFTLREEAETGTAHGYSTDSTTISSRQFDQEIGFSKWFSGWFKPQWKLVNMKSYRIVEFSSAEVWRSTTAKNPWTPVSMDDALPQEATWDWEHSTTSVCMCICILFLNMHTRKFKCISIYLPI